MEKGTIGRSRKFKSGSIHEIASGKLMIMDRFIGDDDKIWLRYQWISGDNEGKIEENKEENINASLYKFKISRGFKGATDSDDTRAITPSDNFDKLEVIEEKLDGLIEGIGSRSDRLTKMEVSLYEQRMLIDKLVEMVRNDTDNRALVAKLIEKM